MPTIEKHLDQVRRNEALAHRLLNEPGAVPEWAITLLFYAAVHLVEAYFAYVGVPHPDPPQRQTHANRRRLMRERVELSDTRAIFYQLQADSETMRYECGAISVNEALALQQAYEIGFAAPVRALLVSSQTQG